MPLPTDKIQKGDFSRGRVELPIEKLGDRKFRVKFAPDYLIIEGIGNKTLIVFRDNEIKLSGYPPKIYVNGRRAITTNYIDRWNDKYRTFYEWNDRSKKILIRCRISELDYALLFHFIDTAHNSKLFSVIIDERGKQVKFKHLAEKAIILWKESATNPPAK